MRPRHWSWWLIGLLFSHMAPAAELAPPASGQCTFVWTAPGERFSIWAEDAPVSEILRDLGHLHGAELTSDLSPDDRRTFRLFDLTLLELLDRLDVNYRLNYTRAPDGGKPVLTGGSAGDQRQATGVQSISLPTGPEADRIRALLKDLLDDDIRWNFEEALSQLLFDVDPAMALPFLISALDSTDLQQRYGVRQVIESYAYRTRNDGTTPDWKKTYPFLQNLVFEAMRDDALFEETSDPRFGNDAQDSVYFYHRSPDQIRDMQPAFEQGLWDSDRQLRFLSAALLGGSGLDQQSQRILDILTPQLMDNQTPMDSRLAVYGIVGLGPSRADEYLSAFEARADEQARGLIHTIRTFWKEGNFEEVVWDYLKTHPSWTQDSFAP